MRSTFKILFYINKQRAKADGNTVTFCRIIIDGKNVAITTGEECQPSEWNTKQGLTTNRKTNQRINEFGELVEKIYRDILTRDGVVSVKFIKNRLQGIATNLTTLLAMSRAEFRTVKKSVGRSRAGGTYLDLFCSDRNLREFVENRGVQGVSIETVAEDLFGEYHFLLRERGLKASTVNSNLCWLSRLMFCAVGKRIIRCNPFENAKFEKEEEKVRFLQKNGMMKLTAVRVSDKKAELARLMFVFSCFTGLIILDMENLEYKHIQTATDRQMYIKKRRQKTKAEFIAPLHPIAETIISHYQKESERSEVQQTMREKSDHFVFHRDCSRSVVDAKLNIVGEACGIYQRLSYRMTKHTFDAMSLSTGMPIKNIAKMMGHTSISSTQVYAQVTDRKVSEDIDRLIAKQSAEEKETSERGACGSSDIMTCKAEESARGQATT